MSRTIQISVFSFDELSEAAKEKAYNEWLSEGHENPWRDDNLKSLKEFYDIFPVRQRGREWTNFEMTCDNEVTELSGLRLAKYIWNNYRQDLFTSKYYSKGFWIDGQFTYKFRRSKIQFDNSCVLTGYYMDDTLLAPIYKFLDSPDDSTFEELLQDCVNEWERATEQDNEYYFSIENFAETCAANGWEFSEDGEFI